MSDTPNNDMTNKIGNLTATSGHIVHFVHVATGRTCHFKAFLTAWEDSFKQDWTPYEKIGRAHV